MRNERRKNRPSSSAPHSYLWRLSRRSEAERRRYTLILIITKHRTTRQYLYRHKVGLTNVADKGGELVVGLKTSGVILHIVSTFSSLRPLAFNVWPCTFFQVKVDRSVSKTRIHILLWLE